LYATAFSGFYLALFLILRADRARLSFEFWARSVGAVALDVGVGDGDRVGAAALLFGVAWANFVKACRWAQRHRARVLLTAAPYALLARDDAQRASSPTAAVLVAADQGELQRPRAATSPTCSRSRCSPPPRS